MAGRTAADPLVVAAAIIEREGRYLIAQRRRDSMHGGQWEFPGGKREAGETVEECLRREVREELGVEVAVRGLERVIRHVYDYGWVELHFFRCALTKGEPQTLGCQAIRWVLPAELAEFTFPPANRPLIETLVDKGST
ncbi:MAG TPA: (deoxy)nucleoside triphosphate pyrophosphohydrolase [Nitrospiria bacterium]|nr:(deoxy)nucleoside triphosphate pyrophosphohydrolase [Nitrospiria bacterium]